MLRYAITDPAYYTDDPTLFADRVARMLLSHRPDMVCFRDKRTGRYETVAEAFLSLKERFPKTLFLLHGDPALAVSLRADGVHLPSDGAGRIEEAKRAGLFCIVSTHSLEEAAACEALGADAVTFSPVFASPGKGEPQGLEKLKEIKDKISLKTIALGGIVTREQIEAVEEAGADGFASIRYFVP
ncbi:thiamine phosphate synthase [Hydrogenimonas sp. SS33]|uniref:thiamine phosphate synthase n=1 Tax=Hydrogenimonas leucolamina TaxID=2954236 RepID=UPI00336C0894